MKYQCPEQEKNKEKMEYIFLSLNKINQKFIVSLQSKISTVAKFEREKNGIQGHFIHSDT